MQATHKFVLLTWRRAEGGFTPGYATSVLGNDKAFGLAAAVTTAVDLIVIGFSAPYPVRAAMIRWFKQQYLNIPILALRFHSAESFTEADGGTVSDDPDVWLMAVASILKKPT